MTDNNQKLPAHDQQGYCRVFLFDGNLGFTESLHMGEQTAGNAYCAFATDLVFPDSQSSEFSYFYHCERKIFCWCINSDTFLVFPCFPVRPRFFTTPSILIAQIHNRFLAQACSFRPGPSVWVYSFAALLWRCFAIGPTAPVRSFLRVPPTPLSRPSAVATLLLMTRHASSTSAVANMATAVLPLTSVVKAARATATCLSPPLAPQRTHLRFEPLATTNHGRTPAGARPCRQRNLMSQASRTLTTLSSCSTRILSPSPKPVRVMDLW